jgi:uncharacterized protein
MLARILIILLLSIAFHAPAGESVPAKILDGAQKQLVEKAQYSPGYVKLSYPNGDLPRDRGVCTDVLIRALRNAGLDLQQLVHEDMQRDFSKYPRKWGLNQPDANIDHRRVPNLIFYFSRHATILKTDTSGNALNDWAAGDLVFWKLDSGLDHCGVVSDKRNAAGVPLVIHNISQCSEDDCLTKWKITAHVRL